MNFLLKQRLVGAVVLVALAVIFIPMLLEGPDRNLVPEMAPLPEPGDLAIDEPLERFPQVGEIPDAPQRSVIQDQAPEEDSGEGGTLAAGEQAELPLPVPEPPSPDPESEPAGRPVPSPAESTDSPPQEPDAGAAEAPGPLGNWVVQVGSFSSRDNALRLRDKLREQGFATQVEKVLVGGKTHYRVRTGPYLERAGAEQDRDKLEADLDLNGRVLSYP